MEELETTIEKVLAAKLPGVQVLFDSYPGYGKLHATIVWNEFEEQSLIERQRQVWDTLRLALTEEQKYATGFLLTVTPTELTAMQAVAA